MLWLLLILAWGGEFVNPTANAADDDQPTHLSTSSVSVWDDDHIDWPTKPVLNLSALEYCREIPCDRENQLHNSAIADDRGLDRSFIDR